MIDDANPYVISIHALREESDGIGVDIVAGLYISIHALREESDTISTSRQGTGIYFNPRSP